MTCLEFIPANAGGRADEGTALRNWEMAGVGQSSNRESWGRAHGVPGFQVPLDGFRPQIIEFFDGADVQKPGFGIQIAGYEHLFSFERPCQAGGVECIKIAVKLTQRETGSMPDHRAAEAGQRRTLRHHGGGGGREGEGNRLFRTYIALGRRTTRPGKHDRESEPERQTALNHIFHGIHISGDPERAAKWSNAFRSDSGNAFYRPNYL